MEFRETLRRRRMVRRYTDEPVDRAVVERIVDAARRAPTAGHSQGQFFVVATETDARRQVAAAAGEQEWVAKGFEPWLSAAPVHVVPCASESVYRQRYAEQDKSASRVGRDWEVPFWWVDGGAAMMTLLLAAVDEGLAAGFLAVEADRLRGALGIPDDVAPIGVVTIGHPASDRRSGSLARGRKAWEDQVRWQRWDASDPTND